MNTPVIAGLAATAALLGSSAVAHAEAPSPTYRSAETATWLSLGGVAASGVALAAGIGLGGDAGVAIGVVGATSLLITPSIGHFYSGTYLSNGLITRAAGTVAMGIGAYMLASSFDLLVEDDDDEGQEAVGTIAFFGGGVAFVTGTILDVVTAGSAAHAWNAKHRLLVTPTAISTPAGSAFGVGLGGRF